MRALIDCILASFLRIPMPMCVRGKWFEKVSLKRRLLVFVLRDTNQCVYIKKKRKNKNHTRIIKTERPHAHFPHRALSFREKSFEHSLVYSTRLILNRKFRNKEESARERAYTTWNNKLCHRSRRLDPFSRVVVVKGRRGGPFCSRRRRVGHAGFSALCAPSSNVVDAFFFFVARVALVCLFTVQCFDDDGGDRKSTRLNSSHMPKSRMPSSA